MHAPIPTMRCPHFCTISAATVSSPTLTLNPTTTPDMGGWTPPSAPVDFSHPPPYIEGGLIICNGYEPPTSVRLKHNETGTLLPHIVIFGGNQPY